jgi:hypothetical protein
MGRRYLMLPGELLPACDDFIPFTEDSRKRTCAFTLVNFLDFHQLLIAELRNFQLLAVNLLALAKPTVN